ncbi:MAG: hypothetical protein HZA62_09385 [Rhodocyclales bacterium]|nr:hypothetical protein [Rhodocyclales bacterium]
MLARFFAVCGYTKPDDLVDFLMTGVAVAPIVVFLGCGFDEAFLVMLALLGPVFFVFPWIHARDNIRRHQEAEREVLLRRITGQGRK